MAAYDSRAPTELDQTKLGMLQPRTRSLDKHVHHREAVRRHKERHHLPTKLAKFLGCREHYSKLIVWVPGGVWTAYNRQHGSPVGDVTFCMVSVDPYVGSPDCMVFDVTDNTRLLLIEGGGLEIFLSRFKLYDHDHKVWVDFGSIRFSGRVRRNRRGQRHRRRHDKPKSTILQYAPSNTK
jgi:hypothetical protein